MARNSVSGLMRQSAFEHCRLGGVGEKMGQI